MNVAAYQEKEKNNEVKTGKRKAGEGIRLATDFKEECAALLRLFRGKHCEKWFVRGECPG